MKVKSGVKDFGRVLDVPFGDMNRVTKKLDEILDDTDASFEKYDALKDGNENEQLLWQEFRKLEEEYPEVFRLARKFEGIPRGFGVHASGILISPVPVRSAVPVRIAKDGSVVTLYSGTQLEALGFIKFDILGLRTISVIVNTLRNIHPDMTIEMLYDQIDLDNKDAFQMLCDKKTDGVFQMESGLFKGMMESIRPTCLEDLTVINSLGRPGPLSIGMPQQYAEAKNRGVVMKEMLPNTADICASSLGTLVYQEQLMLITKRVAGFNDTQSDSIARKTIAKKKKEMMDMFRRCFIYGKLNTQPPMPMEEMPENTPYYDAKGKYGGEIPGGIAMGYKEEELQKFFHDIQGFASYLFNRSHKSVA